MAGASARPPETSTQASSAVGNTENEERRRNARDVKTCGSRRPPPGGAEEVHDGRGLRAIIDVF